MTRPTPDVLNERAREILREVILSYIVRAEPISSRAIAKQYVGNLSSATIRNIMADLEDLGYLYQPHTSAGRVPTSDGYHYFIDCLMSEKAPSADHQRYIEATLNGADDADALTYVASQLLSELSQQVGIVLSPTRGDVRLRSIDFVPLRGNKVLCVVVDSAGLLDNRVIETEEVLPREELIRMSNYLTENFAGLALREVRDRLLLTMVDEKAQIDTFMSRAMSLAARGLPRRDLQSVVVEGAQSLLALPELADIERVQKLFETFTDKAQLVTMLNRCLEGPGVRVLIGEDSDLTSQLDFSLVATTYGVGKSQGSLGIFGPSRMEYPRLVPLVNFLGRALSSVLERAESHEELN